MAAGNSVSAGIAYTDPNLSAVIIAGVDYTSLIQGLPVILTTTATTAELNTLHNIIASMTTTATPASGTCGVQFVFKNAAGTTIATNRAMVMYLSGSTGLPVAAQTSVAALINGYVDTTVTGKVAQVTTSAAGLLGVTLTATAGTYYLSFVLPNGAIITSSALVVN